jgi:uncharacterized protein GlcG (DUF336 family)
MDLLAVSKAVAEAAEGYASRMGVAITVSVVDVHGNLVLKHRMPDARLICVEMSERKAYTSAVLHMATKDMTDLAQPGQPLHGITSFAGGRCVAFGGGAPLVVDGRIVAGVGVSGGTTEEDIEILEATLTTVTGLPMV